MSHTYSALKEYRKRVAAMIDDPDCNGDLLLLGISLLDFAVLRINRDEKSWSFYADRVLSRSWSGRVRQILRDDIRRYDGIQDAEASGPARQCGAPMVRRHGPCGNSAGLRALLTDADTGRKQWLAACSRHRDWFEGCVRANRTQVEVANPERPTANAGGVLARHIPEIDWERTWKKIDPAWTPPPESEPEEVPLKPKLTLVLGGEA